MSNFAFLPQPFSAIADDAIKAESYVHGDPRTACFYARRALERLVHWLYRYDNTLRLPHKRNIGTLLNQPDFETLLPIAVLLKAIRIQQEGNDAVHGDDDVPVDTAMTLVHELHHVCYWLMSTYLPRQSRDGAGWKDDRVPRSGPAPEGVSRRELQALEEKLAAQAEAAWVQQQANDALDAEVQALRAQVAERKAEAAQQADTHDYSEADTRTALIDAELARAGWTLDRPRDREFRIDGMPNEKGVGYADYVLWGDDGQPLAVIEAKRTMVDPEAGQQQAKLYADGLQAMFGQRPLIFFTNGYAHRFWDDLFYPPRRVGGFHAKEALSALIVRRTQRSELLVKQVNDDIAGRYYQKRVIRNVFEQFGQRRHRKALLVMATGTGKTRTAIALVDALQRAGWIKRALFLADRTSLVKQAANAFKTHLPESSPVNLVTDKRASGRVYLSTYPTMMGLIDDKPGEPARFGIGHFDLIVIDEAHRSVYRKYRQIFDYFDSLLVGLTATPSREIDRDTYGLFDLATDEPTDAYELQKAVDDGFLVPPEVHQIDMRFPREGIDYDDLDEDEKIAWETADWGDEDEPPPVRVNAPAINSWLFNENTVDQVLLYLMQHGHTVHGGDRLGKTIVFARNHDHAMFIEQRFNHHYPEHAGHFARVIDNRATYPQSLIDAFGEAGQPPHIAISVDMLDTGIDVPEVLNLVFFKPVYSKIKFWQMIGRGTRLCPDVFGPDEDKRNFRVFDACFNFDFFREHPDGRTTSDGASLGTRLFQARVQLIGHVQGADADENAQLLGGTVADLLHAEVAAMSADNFIVRLHGEPVDRFRDRRRWDALDDDDRATLAGEVAGLPSAQETDAIESRLFDLIALRLQLAVLEGDAAAFETYRARVIDMAALLEDKRAVPAVAEQLAFLASIQEADYWQDIDVVELEDLRERLRALVPLLDRGQRKVVYTDFQDEITGVRPASVIELPNMTGAQYEKRVRAYLDGHRDHLVVARLRANQPLTDTDLRGLERTLAEIGEADGDTLLSELLERSDAPTLAWFVRSLVGMDRTAAQAAFSDYLNDRELSAAQIRFVELVVEQLTARGVMEAGALYEAPFTNLHAGGPEELFSGRDKVVAGVFGTLRELHAGLIDEGAASAGTGR